MEKEDDVVRLIITKKDLQFIEKAAEHAWKDFKIKDLSGRELQIYLILHGLTSLIESKGVSITFEIKI
jgi:hypothetical protein